jgi:hypothetical protein
MQKAAMHSMHDTSACLLQQTVPKFGVEEVLSFGF